MCSDKMLITVDCESRETFAVGEERTSSFPKVKAWFGSTLPLLFIAVLAIHGTLPYTATVCAKFRSLSPLSLSSWRKIDRETVVLQHNFY